MNLDPDYTEADAERDSLEASETRLNLVPPESMAHSTCAHNWRPEPWYFGDSLNERIGGWLYVCDSCGEYGYPYRGEFPI